MNIQPPPRLPTSQRNNAFTKVLSIFLNLTENATLRKQNTILKISPPLVQELDCNTQKSRSGIITTTPGRGERAAIILLHFPATRQAFTFVGTFCKTNVFTLNLKPTHGQTLSIFFYNFHLPLSYSTFPPNPNRVSSVQYKLGIAETKDGFGVNVWLNGS
jgi:hypothetical protein